MAFNITNLPIEIILLIFSYLNRSDVILNCAKTTHLWKYIVVKFYIEPFIKFLAERKNIDNEIWNIENVDVIKVYETLKNINHHQNQNVLDILISPDELTLCLGNFYKEEKYPTTMGKILQQFQVTKHTKSHKISLKPLKNCFHLFPPTHLNFEIQLLIERYY